MSTPSGSKAPISPSPASSRSQHAQRRQMGSSRQQTSRGRASRSHRQGQSSMALIQQKLAEMGSYAKYYKAITSNPFQVKIRCSCGRSRNMAWMFLCTWCATGTEVEKDDKEKGKENDKDKENKEKEEKKEEETKGQRLFLSCDLCAQKMTESYYCPHCLAAYPAHYVKLHTRCTRCVSCPVCTSPLEKIVYSGTSTGGDSKDKEKKKDVYLYQCPFCFWSSNIVGLEASESEALLENLKEKLKRPVEEKSLIMSEIKNKYITINEELRKEEDRIEKAKRFHTYKGGRSLLLSGSDKKMDGKKKKKTKMKKGGHVTQLSTLMSVTSLSHNIASMQNVNVNANMSAIEKMDDKLRQKFEQNHVLDKNLCKNIETPLDLRYVSQFHLRNVSPLQHRLNDPLLQSVDMDKYVPQRFHLMTKESYKCPSKQCGKYVCKPTLRGRQANYDKRTAVLDYLPRINIKLKSGNLKSSTSASIIIIMVQNRHLHPAKFKFDCSINDDDLYSTANVSCSDEWYEIDPADIHIKGGKQKDVKKINGDYIKGKEAGIHFEIKPKFYTEPRDIKFSVKCIFETKLELKDDKSSTSAIDDKNKNKNQNQNKNDKNPLIDAQLPYILDFELGPPGGPQKPSSSKATTTATATTSTSTSTSTTTPSTTTTSASTSNNDVNSVGHKSRGSSETVPTPHTQK